MYGGQDRQMWGREVVFKLDGMRQSRVHKSLGNVFFIIVLQNRKLWTVYNVL
jgi:hypothetical protein